MILAAVGLIGGCKKSGESGDDAARLAAATIPVAANPVAIYPAATQPGKILAGDLLGIEIDALNSPEVTTFYPQQVAGNGTILPLYLNAPVMVVGITSPQAAKVIGKAYESAHFMAHAQVGVRRLRIAGTGGPPPGVIANHDLLRVAICDLSVPGTTTVWIARVDGEGYFDLPYVGRQKLAGVIDQQAQASIIAAYQDANVSQHAGVVVMRLEAAPPEAGKIDLPDVPIYPIPKRCAAYTKRSREPRGTGEMKGQRVVFGTAQHKIGVSSGYLGD